MEKEFDDIATGKRNWTDMLRKFYDKFHPQVENTLTNSEYAKGERLLGNDPETGKPVIVKMGRYGAFAQLGESTLDKEDEEKPKFASLRKGQNLEAITLEEALQLFKLPRTIGEYEGKELVIGIGRFGPYVRHDSKFYSLKRGVDDPYTIEAERAIELIEEKRKADKNKVVKEFKENKDLKILNGRWGPYLKMKDQNFRIPKGNDAAALNYDDCMKIINNAQVKKKTTK